jgi:hypothetical protein
LNVLLLNIYHQIELKLAQFLTRLAVVSPVSSLRTGDIRQWISPGMPGGSRPRSSYTAQYLCGQFAKNSNKFRIGIRKIRKRAIQALWPLVEEL